MRDSRIDPARSVFAPTLLLLLIFPAMSMIAGGRADREGTVPAAPPNQFIIRLKPARPGAEATEEDKARITRHFAYLKELQAGGKLLLAGMATDDYEEIVVIKVQDRLEAERIMVSDPAVGGNVLRAELHPFTVVLAAGGK